MAAEAAVAVVLQEVHDGDDDGDGDGGAVGAAERHDDSHSAGGVPQ